MMQVELPNSISPPTHPVFHSVPDSYRHTFGVTRVFLDYLLAIDWGFGYVL
jgi:hypothetical protein